MALMINENCTACDACKPVCPNDAIASGTPIYTDALRCTEYVGAEADAPAWPVAQLAAIDRNILRLAIFEVLIDNKVPVKAAINEAVELAKLYGSDSTPRFVNGVLGSLAEHQHEIEQKILQKT